MNRHSTVGASIAVGVLAVSVLAGCATTPASTGPSAAAANKVGKIVYIPGLTGNPFYSTVVCGANTAAKKAGVDFSTQGASTWDVAKQTEIVNAVVASKPGAIMISITDPKAMIIPLTAAKEAGIPVLGIDGDLSDPGVMVSNIQADGIAGGELAGNALAKLIGGKGSVMTIDNATGSIVSKARTDGFEKAIAQFPGIKFLGIQFSGNDVSKAASFASTTATTNPDLAGIFSAETNNTEGAITGLRESGFTGKVKLVGYDTSDPIVAALKSKTLDGTVVQNPRGEGALGVETLIAAMQGKTVIRQQSAAQVFATPDNYTDPKITQYIYDINCTG